MAIRYASYNNAIAVRYRGAWNSGLPYGLDDRVYFGGAIYTCLVTPTIGAVPSGSPGQWYLTADGSRTNPFPVPAVIGLTAGDELRIAGNTSRNTRVSLAPGDDIQIMFIQGATTIAFYNGDIPLVDATTVVSLYDMVGNDAVGYVPVNSVAGSSGTTSRTWTLPTVKLPLYKLNTINDSQPAAHKLIDCTGVAGTADNPIKVSGNWDISKPTPDQSAFTLFNQTVQTTPTGYGVYTYNSPGIAVSDLAFSRYQYGTYASSGSHDLSISNCVAESGTTGFYANIAQRIKLTNLKSVRNTTGIYLGEQSNYAKVRGYVAEFTSTALDIRASNVDILNPRTSNSAYDVNLRYGVHNRVLGLLSTASAFIIDANNLYDAIFDVTTSAVVTGGQYSIQLTGCQQTRVYISGTPVKVRHNNYQIANAGNVVVGASSFVIQNDITFPGVLSEYTSIDSSGDATFVNQQGTSKQVAASDINEVTQHTPKSRVWKLLPNTYSRTDFPLAMRIARVAVAPNKPVKASIWMKRSAMDSRIHASLACVGDNTGIEISEAVLPDPQASPVNQNDFVKVTLTVTPTRRGVIAFEVRSWLTGGITSGSIYVDGFSVRQ